jgi:hypothetical protein
MSGAQRNDVGHENALTRGDILAATATAQFYNFANRCMDWAKTTRSLQERAVYVQMGLQWLAAGARLQTFLQFKISQDVSLKAATENRRFATAREPTRAVRRANTVLVSGPSAAVADNGRTRTIG